MGKFNYLNVKYKIPHEYSNFIKSKTKYLNKYLLFKLLLNLLEEMYYSIHCYKILNRKIKASFDFYYKHLYIIRLFITRYLMHGMNNRFINIYNKLLLTPNKQYLYFKQNFIKNKPFILFIKLLLLLLHRRTAIYAIVSTEKTFMYYIRQISNYIFFEKHMNILLNIDEKILKYELRKRIIDSIFNINRYSHKKKFINKQYILNTLSFNIILSHNRFDLIKKPKRYRTFYFYKLKFRQFYKTIYNIKTTKIFNKYIQFINSRLRQYIDISSIYFQQIYIFLYNCFFCYLGIIKCIQELKCMNIGINEHKYSISNFYYFLIGDKIELNSIFFTYTLVTRKLCIIFAMSQLFYNCCTSVQLQENMMENEDAYYLDSLINTNSMFRRINIYLFDIIPIMQKMDNNRIDTNILTQSIYSKLALLTNINIRKHLRTSINIRRFVHLMHFTKNKNRLYKKKNKRRIFKNKYQIQDNYNLIGYTSIYTNINVYSKILTLYPLINIYKYYIPIIFSINMLIQYTNYILFADILKSMVCRHIYFISVFQIGYFCDSNLELQLCNSNIKQWLHYLTKNIFFNKTIQLLECAYLLFFDFNTKIKKKCAAIIMSVFALCNNSKLLRKRMYISGIFNALNTSNINNIKHINDIDLSLDTNINFTINSIQQTNLIFRYINKKLRAIGISTNNLFNLIDPYIKINKILIFRMYSAIYYCTVNIISYFNILYTHYFNSIPLLNNLLIMTHSNIITSHLKFFPKILNFNYYHKKKNLFKIACILLYLKKKLEQSTFNCVYFLHNFNKKFNKKKKNIYVKSKKYQKNKFDLVDTSTVESIQILKQQKETIRQKFESLFINNFANIESHRIIGTNQQNIRLYHTNKQSIDPFVRNKQNNKKLIQNKFIQNKRNNINHFISDKRNKHKKNIYYNRFFQNQTIISAQLFKNNLRFGYKHKYYFRFIGYTKNKFKRIVYRGVFVSIVAILIRLSLQHLIHKKKHITFYRVHKKNIERFALNRFERLVYLIKRFKLNKFHLLHKFKTLKKKMFNKKISLQKLYGINLLQRVRVQTHTFVNIYVYLQYLKQWISKLTSSCLNNIVYNIPISFEHDVNLVSDCNSNINLFADSNSNQDSVSQMIISKNTLNTRTDYLATLYKLFDIAPLLYSVSNNNFKFILYSYPSTTNKFKINLIEPSSINVPSNIRYLFTRKSYITLQSKFR